MWIEFLKSLLWLDEIPAVWFPKEKGFIKYGDVVFVMLKSGEFFYSRSIAHWLSPLDLKWKLYNQKKNTEYELGDIFVYQVLVPYDLYDNEKYYRFLKKDKIDIGE